MKKLVNIVFYSIVVMSGILLHMMALSAVSYYVISPLTQTHKKEALAQPIKPDGLRKSLLDYVNKERQKNGSDPLVEDVRLDQSAQWKADDMNTRSYFSHNDPVSGRMNGLDKINEIDKDCSWVSENLQWDYDPVSKTEIKVSAEGIVDSWIKSTTHHTAMIDKRYDFTGFGIAGDYVVEHFCDAK